MHRTLNEQRQSRWIAVGSVERRKLEEQVTDTRCGLELQFGPFVTRDAALVGMSSGAGGRRTFGAGIQVSEDEEGVDERVVEQGKSPHT